MQKVFCTMETDRTVQKNKQGKLCSFEKNMSLVYTFVFSLAL